MSAHEAVRAFITDPVLQKRLAKYLVLQCFRNSRLEDLHAGISPSSACGDYSDVHVTSPYGSIPWAKASRFNDDEMKDLMVDVVNRTYASYAYSSMRIPAPHCCFSLRNTIRSLAGTSPRYRITGSPRHEVRYRPASLCRFAFLPKADITPNSAIPPPLSDRDHF